MPKHDWTTEEVATLEAFADCGDALLARIVSHFHGFDCTATMAHSACARNGISRATRKPKTAKAAGKRFEREVADYLAAKLEDDRIDRMPLHGSKDMGDVMGLRLHGGRVCVECKNTNRLDLAGWLDELEREMGNGDMDYGFVAHKRVKHGVGGCYVTTTLDQMLAMGWMA